MRDTIAKISVWSLTVLLVIVLVIMTSLLIWKNTMKMKVNTHQIYLAD